MSVARPVAITGIGCWTAAGNGLDACLDSMLRKERAPEPPRRFTTAHPDRYPAFEIFHEFEPDRLPDEARRLRTTHLAVATAHQAVEDAGWTVEALSRLRVGVCVGTTVGGALNQETFYRRWRDGLHPSTEGFYRLLNESPADVIAREMNLRGPRQTVVNACSSGTDAIGLGAAWIRSGLCDVVLAGGADELCRVTYSGFISLMVTSEAPCRPFDAKRKGLNLGEGAAVLLLESDAVCAARARKPRARVYGYGAACDAYHLTAPHPEGRGLRQALASALEEWGGEAKDLAFVNAHGTSTPDNDRVEGRVLADLLPNVPFHSTKGYTGHTLGAAGAVEAAFAVGFLERGVAAGSVGFEEPDPAIGAVPFSEPLKLSGRFALSESLAFGGSNAVVVLGVDP
jgi:3-oxoacyl-[acyl-carrier-protein] synthase-1/3-oxoacyl-[acyl-carrier-protein] synthase II